MELTILSSNPFNFLTAFCSYLLQSNELSAEIPNDSQIFKVSNRLLIALLNNSRLQIG